MTVDREGRLWAATDAAVQVLSPEGRTLGRIPLPEKGSNCCFGGDAGTTLFVTAGASLYAIETTTRAAR
jgi:gluconolactonase